MSILDKCEWMKYACIFCFICSWSVRKCNLKFAAIRCVRLYVTFHYEDETEELSESSKQEKANKEILIISSSRRGTYLIALVVESLKLQHTENEQFYQTNMVMTFRTKDQLN